MQPNVSVNSKFHLQVELELEDHKRNLDKKGTAATVDEIAGYHGAICRHSSTISNLTSRESMQQQQGLSVQKQKTFLSKKKIFWEGAAAAFALAAGFTGIASAGFGAYAGVVGKTATIGATQMTWKSASTVLGAGQPLMDGTSRASGHISTITDGGNNAKQTEIDFNTQREKQRWESETQSQGRAVQNNDAIQQMLRAHFEARSQQMVAIARLSAGAA